MDPEIALREREGRELPPRWNKLFAVAQAEGVLGRWIPRSDLSSILDRHHVSDRTSKSAYEQFYPEQDSLSEQKYGVPWYVAKELQRPFADGEGVLALDSYARRLDAMETIQDLRFSLGSFGAAVVEYPVIHWAYAIVRVWDRELFVDFIKQTRHVPMPGAGGHGRWFGLDFFEDPDWSEEVISDAEVEGILARDPAKPNFSLRWQNSAPFASPTREQQIAELKARLDELTKKLGI